MTKREKRLSEFLGVKMGNFLKNRHSEILVRKKFSAPQTRRQVSATGSRYSARGSISIQTFVQRG